MANAFSSSAIVGLGKLCRPTAVVGFISAIIVDAIEGVRAGWTRTHIGEEQDKITPSFAGRDASSAIAGVVVASGIVASLNHRGPRIVFRNFVALPMCSIFETLLSKAAAGEHAAHSKVGAGGLMFLSAITKAIPQLHFGDVVQRRQFSKTLIGDIDELGHPPVYHNLT